MKMVLMVWDQTRDLLLKKTRRAEQPRTQTQTMQEQTQAGRRRRRKSRTPTPARQQTRAVKVRIVLFVAAVLFVIFVCTRHLFILKSFCSVRLGLNSLSLSCSVHLISFVHLSGCELHNCTVIHFYPESL